MKRILVITNNLEQASYRVRVAALIEPLRARGFELDVHVRSRSRGERRAMFLAAGEYHAVLLQRKLLDPCDARLLRRHAQRILYDVDDAVMYHAHPVGWFSRWRTTRRFRATAANVDHVVAGNAYLADLFRRAGAPAASVVPTGVDPGRYLVKEHEATDAPRLVWIGSKSTLPYLADIVPLLARAAEQVPGLRLLTIADATVHAPALPVEHAPWSAEGEAAALIRGDIGIAPTPCNPWTLGKCGFKIVQYMAAGLPVIASPIGANAEIVRNGETGFLPAAPDEWPALIAKLADDVSLRARMGEAGRQRVKSHYSIESAADAWAELLR
ncbi:MAG TPA: glycosyltransferase family 4 protein [Tepidisphaeraceae bacterium]|nr:glycosyltransferase family 4 protein [Tepidisphaeraceae bacterium]